MLRANYLGEGGCYGNVLERRTVARNILFACHRLFVGATAVQHLDSMRPYIVALRTGLDDPGRDAMYKLITSFDPFFLDAIRIATCFENLYKARLLLAGFVVHEIEKNPRWKHMAQAQRAKPIRIAAIKRAEGFAGRRDLGYAFTSLSPRTLAWKTLGQPAYGKAARLPGRLYDTVNRITPQRNTLHFLADGGASSYNERLVDDLTYLRAACNRYVVGPANRLNDSFGFTANHLRRVG